MVDAYDRLSADSADSFALRCSHEFIPFTLVMQAIVSRLIVNLLGILGERVPGSPSWTYRSSHVSLCAIPSDAEDRWPVDDCVASIYIHATRACSSVILVDLCSTARCVMRRRHLDEALVEARVDDARAHCARGEDTVYPAHDLRIKPGDLYM